MGGRQSRRFLESAEDYFLLQVLDGPTRGEALLDPVLPSAEVIDVLNHRILGWLGLEGTLHSI